MKREFDVSLEALEQWCNDALTFLPLPDLPQIQESRLKRVKQNSGKPALFEIAEDLAEGLGYLPYSSRVQAQSLLLERYGFGYELFLDTRQRALRKMIRRGKIRDDGEYQLALDFASDTTLAPAVLQSVTNLIGEYEKSR